MADECSGYSRKKGDAILARRRWRSWPGCWFVLLVARENETEGKYRGFLVGFERREELNGGIPRRAGGGILFWA